MHIALLAKFFKLKSASHRFEKCPKNDALKGEKFRGLQIEHLICF